MIRSMTGFGEAERQTEAGTLRVEIRTVNHRHLSVNFRTPPSLAKWEPQMRDWLRAHLSRGHANVAVRLEPAAGTRPVGQASIAELQLGRAILPRFQGGRIKDGMTP